MNDQGLVRSLILILGGFTSVACSDDGTPVVDSDTETANGDSSTTQGVGDDETSGADGSGDGKVETGGTTADGTTTDTASTTDEGDATSDDAGQTESGSGTDSVSETGTEDTTSTSGQDDDSTGDSTGDTTESGFGNCIGDAGGAACLASETCVTDDPDLPGWGFCSINPCTDASECPAAPEGGNPTVACTDVDGDQQDECALSCAGGEVCPDGMECVNDSLCAWTTDVVSDFDGVFCSDFAMALPGCELDLDESQPFFGQLACNPDDDGFFWDVFLLELQQGDCVSVWADNVGAMGPTAADAADLLVVVQNDATNDAVSLDDDVDCSDPAFNGGTCPRGSFTVGDTGIHELGVGQWNDDGCPNPSPYRLVVSVNGVAVDLASVGLSASDYPLTCGF